MSGVGQTVAGRFAERPQLRVYWDLHVVGIENREVSGDRIGGLDRVYLRVESLTLPSMVIDDLPLEGYGETVHFLGGFKFGNLTVEMVESPSLLILREMFDILGGEGKMDTQFLEARTFREGWQYKRDFNFHLYNIVPSQKGSVTPAYSKPYLEIFIIGASFLGFPPLALSHKDVSGKLTYKFNFSVDYMYFKYGDK